MADKILIEDDIIDLTDLLEEGDTPSKTKQSPVHQKAVNEPDSFDLGKEISMEYDVSVEEIEHDAGNLTQDKSPSTDIEPPVRSGAMDGGQDLSKESLGNIEAEIDLAIQDKETPGEVSLTSNEENMLLTEEPVEESPSLAFEKALAAETERVTSQKDGMQKDTPVTQSLPKGLEPETVKTLPVIDIADEMKVGDVPAGIITDAMMNELRKDMPALMEKTIQPLVEELLKEIVTSTREAIPSLVEKVVREEIQKLKKL
jgi:cell pole-organizing protein PopZ